MFIEKAYASTNLSENLSSGIGFGSLWVFVFIFAIMYFLMIRPQQQEQKKHKEKLQAIKRGDQVVTAGGIVAKVKKIDEAKDQLILEASENVEIRVLRSTISDVLK